MKDETSSKSEFEKFAEDCPHRSPNGELCNRNMDAPRNCCFALCSRVNVVLRERAKFLRG